MRSPLFSIPLLLLSSGGLAHAHAQEVGPKGRQMDDSVGFLVRIEIPWTTYSLGDGRDETFTGLLKCWPGEGPHMQAATSIQLRNGRGRLMDVPEQILFRLNDKNIAYGAAEDLSGPDLPEELTHRLLAKSDFALIPLRMLYPQEISTSSGGRAATDVIDHESYHAFFQQKFTGVERISRTPLRSYTCRTVRTFRPSGFQLIDYIQTFEDERDMTVMASFAIRMLVHPDRSLSGDQRPPGGVFHISLIRAYQLDWLKEVPVISTEEWERRFDKWTGRLGDQLFLAAAEEGIGDPFDSSAAVALRVMGVLRESALHRLASTADPKPLAILASQLAELPLAYDPARFAEARNKSADPVTRLLLGTALAAAGGADEELVHEARLALHSTDGRTLRAAFLLARSLADPRLAAATGAATRACSREEDQILGLRALGAMGGADAAASIREVLGSATSARMRAAGLRALADLGDPALLAAIDDSDLSFGAVHPETGQFEMAITDADAARQALEQIARIAAAARRGAAEPLLEALDEALEAPDPNDPAALGLHHAAREWLVRCGSSVKGLGPLLGDRVYADAAYLVAHGSGRLVAGELVQQYRETDASGRVELGRLLGATRDPRAQEFLQTLRDSDDDTDLEAAAAGFEALRRKAR